MNYSKKEAVFMLRKIYILIVLSGVFTIMLYLPSFAEDKEAGPAETGSYIIGPGDILDISVWKDEALTRMPIVLPDGFISFPLIGNIRASGKTVTQLKTEMEGKLARYVPDVILSLDVKQANSMIIYVIGRVNIPGRINLNANVNVLQALATAGGLNIFAKRDNIKIFREENDKTLIFPFEYDKVIEGKLLEENIRLKKGDIVVVP
ncbi:MAG: polysaccharide biosynthesis/export family protein [Proteobacteria bacterium]|nr:polysaccharide biosynthesis/export family protein [Pseudomonadota bacterium]